MNSLLIASDFILLLFLSLIYIGACFIQTSARKVISIYHGCLIVAGIGIIAEILCYSMLGKVKLPSLIFITNLVSDIFIDVNIFFYMLFVSYSLEVNEKTFSRKLRILISSLLAFNILMEILLALMGKSFSLENDHIAYGPLAFLPLIIQVCCFYLSFVNATRLAGAHRSNLVVAVLITLIPYCALFVMYMFSALKHLYIFFVFAYLVIYISLESTLTVRQVEKTNIYKELSITDILTKFYNHTGYQKCLEKISKKEKYGVVFCDVNSLKVTNDTLGHEAGDELIIKVSEIIRESMTDAVLCRISGDEFVCISKVYSSEAYKEKYADLKKAFFVNGRLASCGYSIGKGERILDLIKDAEKKMYEDKEKYYKETGKKRRL